ncbi:MAG: hypothetical protein R3B93_15855 [Bacteroidia bacterium]
MGLSKTLRKETPMNIQQASEQMLGKSAEEVEKMLIIFQRGEQKQEIPFWNVLNGPLADADLPYWPNCFRRASVIQ